MPAKRAPNFACTQSRSRNRLAQIDSFKGILSPGLIGAFVLLGIFPLIAKKVIEMVKARKVYANWAHLKPATFDNNVVVIGAGSGGLVSAYIAARLNVDGPGGRTSKTAAAVLISKAAGAGTNLTVG